MSSENENTVYIVYTLSRRYDTQLAYRRGVISDPTLGDQRDIQYITQSRERALAEYENISLGPRNMFLHSKFVIQTSLEKILPFGMMSEHCVREEHNSELDTYSKFRLNWLIEKTDRRETSFRLDLNDRTPMDNEFIRRFESHEDLQRDPRDLNHAFPEEIGRGETIYVVVPMLVDAEIEIIHRMVNSEYSDGVINPLLSNLVPNSFFELELIDYNGIMFMTRDFFRAQTFFDNVQMDFKGRKLIRSVTIAAIRLDFCDCLYNGDEDMDAPQGQEKNFNTEEISVAQLSEHLASFQY